jgi:hypothetical protein
MPGGVDEVVEFVPPKKDAFHMELTLRAGRFMKMDRLCAALPETRIALPVLHRLTIHTEKTHGKRHERPKRH